MRRNDGGKQGEHGRLHPLKKRDHREAAAQKYLTVSGLFNFLKQQVKFDDFIECYNHERPHQPLDIKYPAELYLPSPRPYRA
jgi:putative transposase